MVSCVWFPEFGFLSLADLAGLAGETFAGELARGTELLRLGEPLGGSWGNPARRDAGAGL